jgi:hypothetical protein
MLYNNLFPEDREYLLQMQKDVGTNQFQVSPEYSQSMAMKMNQINYRAPWLSPEVKLALAKSGATTAAIDQVAKMASQREMDSYDAKREAVGTLPSVVRTIYDAGGWAKRIASKTFQLAIPAPAESVADVVTQNVGALGTVLGRPAKWASRWSLSALMTVPEYANTLIGQVATGKGIDVPGMLSASTFQTMLDNPEKQGTGWLPNARIVEEQASRARAVRGTIYGSAFTLGRGVMSTGGIFRENDMAYRYGSGVIDAIFNVVLPDPSKWISKGIRAAEYAAVAMKTGETIETLMKAGKPSAGLKGIVPLLSEADAASLRKALGPTKQKYLRESGLGMDFSGATYNALQFDKFFRTNPYAIKLVDTLKQSDNAGVIWEDIFDGQISTDMAIRLKNAKTEDQVISALTSGWEFGEKTLQAGIGKYKFERNLVGNTIRKMRAFKEVPKEQIVVSGGDIDNQESIKNMVLSLRAGGASDADVKAFLSGDGKTIGAIEAFSRLPTATPTARKNTLNTYKRYLKTYLRSSGVYDEMIEEILNGGEISLDAMRTYFRSRTGVETDNGLVRSLYEQVKDRLDPDFVNEVLDGAGFTNRDIQLLQPAQLVDLLNRVQILPDTRTIRRLTRGPLFRKLLEDSQGKQLIPKLPITSRMPIRMVDVVDSKNRATYEALKDEVFRLEQLKGPSRANATARIDELKDQMAALTQQKKRPVLTGEQRLSLAFAELLQQRIWKVAQLATGGYVVRNMLDAQVRMAAGGVNQFKHPIDYINAVLGKRYGASITGVRLTDLGVDAGKKAVTETAEAIEAGVRPRIWERSKQEDVWEDLRNAFVGASSRHGWTASDTLRHRHKSGSFTLVTRADGPKKYLTRYHTDGVIQSAQKTLSDEFQSRVAVAISAGKTDDEIVQELIGFMDNERSQAFRSVDALFADGLEFYDRTNDAPYKFPPLYIKELKKSDPEFYRSVLDSYFRHVVLANVKYNTGNLDDITFLFAHNAIGNLDDARVLRAEDFKLKPKEKLQIGQKRVVEINGEKVTGIIQKAAGNEYTFIPILVDNAATAGKNGLGSKEARRMIERARLWDENSKKGLAVAYPREQMINYRPGGRFDSLEERTMNLADKATSWFFDGFYDSASRKLEKSVVFREFYYDEVVKHLDQLSYEEGMKLYADIYEKSGGKIREYLGESNLRQKVTNAIENLPKRKGVTGTLKVEELDDYSRFVGIQRTKELLYDASTRNNFQDALRIVAPFEAAWRDVLGRYASFAVSDNIHMYRQFHKVYHGLSQGDPDMDGRGFIYRDPSTGEQMFTFPMSGSIAKLFTGINSPLSAPLARLSQGISFYPSLGPMASFAVSKILPDVPKYDKLKELLLPYGEVGWKDALNVTPSWLQKAWPAVQGMLFNEVYMNTTYGNTYMETLRALSVNTEKYNLSTEEGVTQLMADARTRAQILTLMRAAGQFTGPAAPTNEFKIPTKQGDKFVDQLMTELRAFETEDYDSAVDRFLGLYGDELVLYLGSKSRAVAQGLEATEEFGVWERENKDIINQYPDTAYFMAPRGGGEFNFTVWERQLLEGTRAKLTDREMIDLAQKRLGSVKYRAARRLFGPNPNELQRDALRNYRQYLNTKLPGFPRRAEFEANKLQNDIDQLYKLVEDPRLKDNAIASSVSRYLTARKQIMQSEQLISFQPKKAAAARQALYQLGESLSAANPEFDRIWQRFLVQEVDI